MDTCKLATGLLAMASAMAVTSPRTYLPRLRRMLKTESPSARDSPRAALPLTMICTSCGRPATTQRTWLF